MWTIRFRTEVSNIVYITNNSLNQQRIKSLPDSNVTSKVNQSAATCSKKEFTYGMLFLKVGSVNITFLHILYNYG